MYIAAPQNTCHLNVCSQKRIKTCLSFYIYTCDCSLSGFVSRVLILYSFTFTKNVRVSGVLPECFCFYWDMEMRIQEIEVTMRKLLNDYLYSVDF